MIRIELEKAWTYRIPEKTIHFPAGAHDVYKYVAEQALEDGAIEGFDGDTE